MCFCRGLSPSVRYRGTRPSLPWNRLIVCQTRADIRVRIRCTVIRIRVRYTASRIRVVVAAIDHTGYGEHRRNIKCKGTHFQRGGVILQPTSTGLRPYPDVLVPRTSRFVASLPLCAFAYATSLAALYAPTLCALTILPRKARREPTFEYESDAPLLAYEYDTPPAAYAP